MGHELTSSEWDDLSAWLDGELPAERAKEIEARVASDPAWADAHRDMQAVEAALDSWQAPAPGDDLAARIRQAARQQRRPLRIPRLAIPLSVAAAAVVLIAVGAAMLDTTPQPVGEATSPVAVAPADDDSSAAEAVPDAFVVQAIDVLAVASAPDSDDLHGRIREITGGSLSESIGAAETTEQRWAALTGEQRDEARQQALAFLKLDPDQQQQLVDSYAQAVAADPAARAAWQQRSRWLKAVLESFTPEQKQALRAMSPAQRAEAFIRRRAELRQQ
jgi:hypothetical protein